MSHPRLATVSLTRSKFFLLFANLSVMFVTTSCVRAQLTEHCTQFFLFLLLVLIINKFDICGTEWDHLSRAMLAKAGVNAIGNSVHWFLSWHVGGWTPIMSLAIIIDRLLAGASKQHRVSLFDVF